MASFVTEAHAALRAKGQRPASKVRSIGQRESPTRALRRFLSRRRLYGVSVVLMRTVWSALMAMSPNDSTWYFSFSKRTV